MLNLARPEIDIGAVGDYLIELIRDVALSISDLSFLLEQAPKPPLLAALDSYRCG